MQHNYVELELFDWCSKENILEPECSMWKWLGAPDVYTIHDFMKGDGPEIDSDPPTFFHKYLINTGNGYDVHPNELGHELIFNKIKNRYEKIKKLYE